MTTQKSNRFDRQIRFFGNEGQDRIRTAYVAVIGIGGLGTHVVQQLALLGVGMFVLIDPEDLDPTNRNRYVGARHDDPISGTPKVDIGERLIQSVDPAIRPVKIRDSFISEQAFSVLEKVGYIFGCLDNEGARLVLNEFSAAHAKPYFDLASDISLGDPPVYGGRICVAWDGTGCLACRGQIDVEEAQAELADTGAQRNREAVYGVPEKALRGAGPSVVSINGVVASYAVTEFFAAITGLRPPVGLAEYRGEIGKVLVSIDPPVAECYYCRGIRGKGSAVGLDRYLRR